MAAPPRSICGYSLIELIVVLVIVGILSTVGIYTFATRSSSSVRGMLDEIEGALLEAHQAAVSTGRDISIVTWGEWKAGGNPLVMARGDGQLTQTVIQTDAINLLKSPPVFSAVPLERSSVAVPFRFAYTPSTGFVSREHLHGGVVVKGSVWWTNAMAPDPSTHHINQDINEIAPFNDATSGFAGILVGGNNLFQGGAAPAAPLTLISGSNKRFTRTFFIQVVSISTGKTIADAPNAIPGGPMGLIVVQNNGATIYKFYNPGVSNGDGKWRRI